VTAAALTLRFLDVVIATLVAELVGLAAYRAATGRGLRPTELAAFLGAGLAMALALRVGVAGGRAEWFAAAMAASLVLHLWHVAQRWHR
jgi:hypothetical protein